LGGSRRYRTAAEILLEVEAMTEGKIYTAVALPGRKGSVILRAAGESTPVMLPARGSVLTAGQVWRVKVIKEIETGYTWTPRGKRRNIAWIVKPVEIVSEPPLSVYLSSGYWRQPDDAKLVEFILPEHGRICDVCFKIPLPPNTRDGGVFLMQRLPSRDVPIEVELEGYDEKSRAVRTTIIGCRYLREKGDRVLREGTLTLNPHMGQAQTLEALRAFRGSILTGALGACEEVWMVWRNEPKLISVKRAELYTDKTVLELVAQFEAFPLAYAVSATRVFPPLEFPLRTPKMHALWNAVLRAVTVKIHREMPKRALRRLISRRPNALPDPKAEQAIISFRQALLGRE